MRQKSHVKTTRSANSTLPTLSAHSGNAFRICVIGHPKLLVDDRPTGSPLGQKPRQLLWYLAIERKAIARRQLASLFWNDREEDRQLANLRQMLSRIRKELGDVIETADPVDSLKLKAQISCDYWRLQDLDQAQFLTESETDWLLAQSTQLLAGIDTGLSPMLDAWLSEQRNVCEGMFVSLLSNCAKQQMHASRYQPARDLLRRWLTLDPCNENAHRLLIQALSLTDQDHAALAQYQTCRQILMEELGIKPTTETFEVYRKIHSRHTQQHQIGSVNENHESGFETESPTSCTEHTKDFFGRQKETHDVLALIRSTESRLVTLTGISGVGKSYLAAEITRHLIHEYGENLHFLEMPVEPACARTLAEKLAAVMDHRMAGNFPVEIALSHAFAEEPILFVLDNLETTNAAATLIESLLLKCKALKILATSRTRLDIEGEWIHRVQGFSTSVDPEETLSPAADYFVHRLNFLSGSTHQISQQDMEEINAICQKTAGLPLDINTTAELALKTTICQTHRSLCLEPQSKTAEHLSSNPTINAEKLQRHWHHLNEEMKHTLLELVQIPLDLDKDQIKYAFDLGVADYHELIDSGWVLESSTGTVVFHSTQRDFLGNRSPIKKRPNDKLLALTTWWIDILGSDGHVSSTLVQVQLPALLNLLRKQSELDAVIRLTPPATLAIDATGAWRTTSDILQENASMLGLRNAQAGMWLLESSHRHNMASNVEKSWHLAISGLDKFAINYSASTTDYIKLLMSALFGNPDELKHFYSKLEQEQLLLAFLGKVEMSWFYGDLRGSVKGATVVMCLGYRFGINSAITACLGSTTIINAVLWHPPGSRVFSTFARWLMPEDKTKVLNALGYLFLAIGDCFRGDWKTAVINLEDTRKTFQKHGAARWECEAGSLLGKCAAFSGRTEEAIRIFQHLYARAIVTGHGLAAIWASQGLAELRLRHENCDCKAVLKDLDRIRHLVPASQLNDPAYYIRLLGLRAEALRRIGEQDAAYREALAGAFAIRDVRYCGFWAHEGFAFVLEVLISQYKIEREQGQKGFEPLAWIKLAFKKMRGHCRRFPPGWASFYYCQSLLAEVKAEPKQANRHLKKGMKVAKKFELNYEIDKINAALIRQSTT